MVARKVAVLGATGSIGGSALDVIARHPERLRASVLAAGSNVDALVALCAVHRPTHAAIADGARVDALRDALRAAGLDTQAHGGQEAIEALAAGDACDTVVAGIVGAAGLGSTLAAARAGKHLLLANCWCARRATAAPRSCRSTASTTRSSSACPAARPDRDCDGSC